LDPGVPSYTPTPLVSEKVVRTLLVVWNFGAPNATPALPSPFRLTAPMRTPWLLGLTGPGMGFQGANRRDRCIVEHKNEIVRKSVHNATPNLRSVG
jgi:hypothetical protein